MLTRTKRKAVAGAEKDHLPLVIEQHAQTCLAMGAELIYLHDLK